MGYMTDGLTFNTLRGGNIARLPQFKNAKGAIVHEVGDGTDCSLNDGYTAMIGEAGEAGNILKKIRRGDFTLDEARQELADEFADIVIYLDILAKRCDIDLGEAVMYKFNFVSGRVGSTIYLDAEDWHHRKLENDHV